MSFLAWIFVGLFAGLLARWIVKDDKNGCLYTVAVGIIGALLGGALMQAAGKEGLSNDFDFRSVLVAAVGAILLLLVLQAVGGRRRR